MRVEMDGVCRHPAVFGIVQLTLLFYHIYKWPNKFDTSMDFHRFICRSMVVVNTFFVSELKNFGVEFFLRNIRHSI